MNSIELCKQLDELTLKRDELGNEIEKIEKQRAEIKRKLQPKLKGEYFQDFFGYYHVLQDTEDKVDYIYVSGLSAINLVRGADKLHFNPESSNKETFDEVLNSAINYINKVNNE